MWKNPGTRPFFPGDATTGAGYNQIKSSKKKDFSLPPPSWLAGADQLQPFSLSLPSCQVGVDNLQPHSLSLPSCQVGADKGGKKGQKGG